jgi:hypothetical protein
VAVDQGDVERERERPHADDQPQHRAAAKEREQGERPDQVVLLLDPERPEVEQRLELGRGVEVARLAPQGDVRDEAGAGGDVLAQGAELVGQQQLPAEQQDRRKHQDQRGEDAADAPPVEARQGEAAGLEVLEDDPGDEEAGDDEEHVDAGEAAGHRAGEGVVAQHRQHRDGAQAVYVRTVRVHSWPTFFLAGAARLR